MYPKKRYLFAALIPHGLYLLSLPISSLLTGTANGPGGSSMPMAIVTIGVVAYLIYLLVATKKLNTTMTAFQQASHEAQTAREAAEDANAAKSNFLAVITHEIRTPMNAVASSVNLLKATPLNEAQTSHLDMLENASEVLLSLLNDVLDLSKIEAGKMSFERTSFDLKDMLDHLQSLFAPQLQEKNLKLIVSVDALVAPRLMGDALRLRQILFNLVSNAIKFTPRGTLSLDISFAANSHTAMLKFDMRDEGIGIAAEDHERIFLSFEQAEAATTRRFGGTGLGLAISRRLARFMGGDITLSSAPGRGACFSLTLPYEADLSTTMPIVTSEISNDSQTSQHAQVLPFMQHESAEAWEHEKPLHILIVDDHEVNRRIVSLFLEPLGWTHDMAANGLEALELCHEQRYDIILMDMQMPIMDGITAVRHIHQERGPNQDTPVVALTANALDSHIQAWREVGVFDILTKPIDPARLISTLRERAVFKGNARAEAVA
jgi:signal transduction histidine kinase/ActR/RegA family two-component response regulator